MWHQASLPFQQMAWAVPFNPMSLGKVAARMGSSTPHFASVALGYLGLISETWRPMPHFASVTLGYLGLISETWRPTPRFASPTLGRRSETWRRLVALPAGGTKLTTFSWVSYLKPPPKRGVAWRRGAAAFWLRRSLRSGFFGRKKHSFPLGSGNPARGGEIPSVTILAGKMWRQGATLLA